MATVLNTYSNYSSLPQHGKVAHLRHSFGQINDEALKTAVGDFFLGKWAVPLSILVILLHVLAYLAYQQIEPTAPVKIEQREILVEIYRPEPPPPEPIIEPPKPIEPPPPPKV